MDNKPEYLFDYWFRHTWLRISRMYNQKAMQHGYSMSVGFILLQIEKIGTPSTQLGPKMGMEPTSLSRTLKSMEENDLIYRVEDKKDRRIVRIHLTEKGLKYRNMSRDEVVSFNKRVMERITNQQLEMFDFVTQEIQLILDQESN
jgi:MarR family transcriptional regulator, organic hydroperoxide resistance regulator